MTQLFHIFLNYLKLGYNFGQNSCLFYLLYKAYKTKLYFVEQKGLAALSCIFTLKCFLNRSSVPVEPHILTFLLLSYTWLHITGNMIRGDSNATYIPKQLVVTLLGTGCNHSCKEQLKGFTKAQIHNLSLIITSLTSEQIKPKYIINLSYA